MAQLEGLGPKRKLFEDLTPGDYLFEIAEPNDDKWLVEFSNKDNDAAKIAYLGWKLRVVSPKEFENKPFFHRTMIAATDEQLALAKRPYDPAGFTYQFLTAIGVAVMQSGEAVILDDYLDADGWFLRLERDDEGDIFGDTENLNKLVGIRFWGSVREEKDRKDSSITRIALAKCWKE